MMNIFHKWLLVLLTVGALAGCATVADPVVRSEQKETVTPLPVKKVLVVVDLGIEFEYLPGGMVYSKQDNAVWRYEPIAKEMVKELKGLGINADYVLHTEKARPVIPPGYSHVWMQRLSNFTLATYSTGDRLVDGRVWVGSLSQLQPQSPGQTFAVIYRSEYASDGPECFSPRVFGNKDDCQKKYVATVLQQWRKSGLTK